MYERLCVFLLNCLIGELTCRYPLKGISLVSLLPYKKRNKDSVTPVSTPTQRGPPGRLKLCVGRAERMEEQAEEVIHTHNLMTKGKKASSY